MMLPSSIHVKDFAAFFRFTHAIHFFKNKHVVCILLRNVLFRFFRFLSALFLSFFPFFNCCLPVYFLLAKQSLIWKNIISCFVNSNHRHWEMFFWNAHILFILLKSFIWILQQSECVCEISDSSSSFPSGGCVMHTCENDLVHVTL